MGWKLQVENNTLWYIVIESKYGGQRNLTEMKNKKKSEFGGNMGEMYMEHIIKQHGLKNNKTVIRNGKKVKFQIAMWIRQQQKCTRLFSISQNKYDVFRMNEGNNCDNVVKILSNNMASDEKRICA